MALFLEIETAEKDAFSILKGKNEQVFLLELASCTRTLYNSGNKTKYI